MHVVPVPTIDPRWSVNETLLRHPRAAAVFATGGVDSCCGGGASLEEAARDADVPLDDLLVALDSVARAGGAIGA